MQSCAAQRGGHNMDHQQHTMLVEIPRFRDKCHAVWGSVRAERW